MNQKSIQHGKNALNIKGGNNHYGTIQKNRKNKMVDAGAGCFSMHSMLKRDKKETKESNFLLCLDYAGCRSPDSSLHSLHWA